MHARSLNSKFLDRLSFSSGQLESLRRLGEHQGKQALFDERIPETLRELRQVATIESSESSNRIEGIEAPLPRIRDIVMKDTAPRNRPEQEIAGYRDALRLVHDSAREMAFTTGVIRQLHQIQYRYTPQPGGQWKATDNAIVEYHVDGSQAIRFRPVPAVATSQAMEDLTSGYARAAVEEVSSTLVVVPLAVLDFLCIHPFRDGNGRVSRLLTLLLLYHHGHHVGRYISLERVVEESKTTYYETLKASSEGWHEGAHDPHPWLNYFWGVLLRAYAEFEDRVGTLREGGSGAKARRVREAALRRTKPFALADLQSDCPGVSLPTIKKELGRMKAEGLVMVQGRGRGARWVVC